MPPSWCPDSFLTEFYSRSNIPLTGRRPFPYPFQQRTGHLLSLRHDFHSIISTFLLFRETCNKWKARSAWTMALISLGELTTLNLRESTQNEDLHSFKTTYPTTLKSSCTLQTTLAAQESATFTLPCEECPSEREHSPSGARGT